MRGQRSEYFLIHRPVSKADITLKFLEGNGAGTCSESERGDEDKGIILIPNTTSCRIVTKHVRYNSVPHESNRSEIKHTRKAIVGKDVNELAIDRSNSFLYPKINS